MRVGYVYILECHDGTFYTGSTIDLNRRFVEHQNGFGAYYTKNRLPVKLIYFEQFSTITEAFQREKQIQKWSRKKKLALMKKDFDRLPHYAKKNFGNR